MVIKREFYNNLNKTELKLTITQIQENRTFTIQY